MASGPHLYISVEKAEGWRWKKQGVVRFAGLTSRSVRASYTCNLNYYDDEASKRYIMYY